MKLYLSILASYLALTNAAVTVTETVIAGSDYTTTTIYGSPSGLTSGVPSTTIVLTDDAGSSSVYSSDLSNESSSSSSRQTLSSPTSAVSEESSSVLATTSSSATSTSALSASESTGVSSSSDVSSSASAESPVTSSSSDSQSTSATSLLSSSESLSSITTLSSSEISSSSASSSSSISSAEASFEAAILAEHNAKRALHGVPSMTWNSTLAEFATTYGNSVFDCDNVQLVHSAGPYGENLAAGYVGGASPVDAWYDEIEYYNFSDPGYLSTTGHFTQVIWKDSVQLGCAYITCNNVWRQYTICEYYPAGNVLGEFAENVLPLVSDA